MGTTLHIFGPNPPSTTCPEKCKTLFVLVRVVCSVCVVRVWLCVWVVVVCCGDCAWVDGVWIMSVVSGYVGCGCVCGGLWFGLCVVVVCIVFVSVVVVCVRAVLCVRPLSGALA